MALEIAEVGDSHIQTNSLGAVTFTPYIGKDGTVGLRARHEQSGREEFIYFNLSDHDGDEDGGRDGGPGHNVFVYQGNTGDPSQDEALHFYYLMEEV